MDENLTTFIVFGVYPKLHRTGGSCILRERFAFSAKIRDMKTTWIFVEFARFCKIPRFKDVCCFHVISRHFYVPHHYLNPSPPQAQARQPAQPSLPRRTPGSRRYCPSRQQMYRSQLACYSGSLSKSCQSHLYSSK